MTLKFEKRSKEQNEEGVLCLNHGNSIIDLDWKKVVGSVRKKIDKKFLGFDIKTIVHHQKTHRQDQ